MKSENLNYNPPLNDQYGQLCSEYMKGKHSGSSFINELQHLTKNIDHTTKNLLLKRVERTCGRHFCDLWNLCENKCQYDDQSNWNEEISHYAPFQFYGENSMDMDVVKENQISNTIGGHESGGFIACPKDNAVQAAEKESHRIAALEDALSFMQRFSLSKTELNMDSVTKTKHQPKRSRAESEGTEQDCVKLVKTEHGKARTGISANNVKGINATHIGAHLEATIIPFRSVPVVDMSQPVSVVAKTIGEACRHVGFFYIVNHGVNEETIRRQIETATKFFDLPSNTKRKLDNRKSKGGIRGYFALGQENLNTAKGEKLARYHGDFKEGFDVGYEVEDSQIQGVDPNGYDGFKNAGNNLWPNESEVEGFKKQNLSYFSEMLTLGRKLMKCFALALELPEDHFDSCLTSPIATLRMLHYPPQNPADTMNKIGCGAHTDYGCCTILLQDSIGGLQVRNSKMQWIHAPPVANSFIINIGDMMSRWTNNVFASTVHRVLNANMPQRDRYSIPFFLNPNFDTQIKCLSSCLKDGRALYETESCEDILMNRYRETFQHLNKDKK